MTRWLPVAVVGVLGSLILFASWVRRAPSEENPTGDVVVVHAGYGDDRFRHGLALMERGAAPTLVLMYGEFHRRSEGLCGQTDPYEVICPTPDEATTIGEARELGRLVEQRGWAKVVTVTSDYHLRRAVYLDRKCGKVEVVGSASSPQRGRRSAMRSLGHEMAAMVQAIAVRC